MSGSLHIDPEERMSSTDGSGSPEYRGEFSLSLYREAQEAQINHRHLAAAVLFGLSMHSTSEDVHPNALYQISWNLALLREWDLSHQALMVLLEHYPLHEAGKQLQRALEAVSTVTIGPDQSFASPKELILICRARSEDDPPHESGSRP